MKKIILLSLLFVSLHQISATTFYQQLCAFNFNWKHYPQLAPLGEAKHFDSDNEYIQAHLSCVIPILQHKQTNELTIAQRKSRKHLIGILDGYCKAGNFPINYYRRERIPVFIDEHQTHCAVGYLLQQTGCEDLAMRIAANDNYVWVKDIHEPELLQWQKESGFSLDELKLIQGAYDYYTPNALYLANKYDVPQKPACMSMCFEAETKNNTKKKYTNTIWLYGEGRNGILNGRWEQYYLGGLPWIEGYFENGKRTGQWKEYYKGTDKLCRTEHWRDNKLNGIRKRYDRNGVLIETIEFKDGKAMVKTNYDYYDSIKWVRVPIDTILIKTEAYTFNGKLLAFGNEKVYNPGNLSWFQNIELTALNSAAISARDGAPTGKSFVARGRRRFDLMLTNQYTTRNKKGHKVIESEEAYTEAPSASEQLYSSTPLVQYKKEGIWTYYNEEKPNTTDQSKSFSAMLRFSYGHFSTPLFYSFLNYDDLTFRTPPPSLMVSYKDDLVQSVSGYYAGWISDIYLTNFNLKFDYYHDPKPNTSLINYLHYSSQEFQDFQSYPRIKAIGQYYEGKKIGTWKHYVQYGRLYKVENYMYPEQDETGKISSQEGH
jgi:antitoxin component YwqK of YwqJK toxin-antitoxin module